MRAVGWVAWLGFSSLIATFIIAALTIGEAPAIDNGQYSHVPKHIRDWFKSVRGKNGVPCCDISDGHRTDFDIRDGAFWVPLNGTWVRVPDDAVIFDSKNPTGDAVVWLVNIADRPFIRCFVPGNGA